MIDPARIWSSAQLPSLPSAAMRLVEISSAPLIDADEFIEVIRTDPAIATRLLKAVNSSYFGLASRVQSLEHAVQLLGIPSTSALALGFSLMPSSAEPGPLSAAFCSFWLQSAAQAAAARNFARRLRMSNPEEAFLIGLLLDLGWLAMLRTIPQECLKVLEANNKSLQPRHAVEQDMLGFTHVEIGVELFRRWNLPEAMQIAIRTHHEGRGALFSLPESDDSLLVKAAALASLTGELYCGRAKGRSLELLRDLAGALCCLPPQKVDDLTVDLASQIDDVAALFDVSTQSLADPADLIAQANEQLVQLALVAQADAVAARGQLEAAERHLQESATTAPECRDELLDPQTKTYNRQYFDDALEQAVEACARRAHAVGLVILELDPVPSQKDKANEPEGALARIARVLGEQISGSEVLARFAEKQFAVLVDQPTEKGLFRLADRLRVAIEREKIASSTGGGLLTLSAGGSTAIPPAADPSESAAANDKAAQELIAAAHTALAEARKAGGNRVHCTSLLSDFDRQLAQEATRRRFSRWLVARGAADVAAVSRALLRAKTSEQRIGELAIELGWINSEQSENIASQAARSRRRFGEAAVAMGLLDLEKLATLLSLQNESPRALANRLVEMEVLDRQSADALVDSFEVEMRIGRLPSATANAAPTTA
jgi:two-component system, cell cycle response regulator